jgi:hypothetical protein
MQIKVLHDATLTVLAGSVCEVSEKQFELAHKLGLVEKYTAPVAKKEKEDKKKKGKAGE